MLWRLILCFVSTMGFAEVREDPFASYRVPSAASAGALDLARLKSLIAESKATSVEDFLAAVAKDPGASELLQQPVLMYDTQSLHRTKLGATLPRLVLYGGRVVLGVSGDPNGPKSNVVEAMEYDLDNEKFRFSSMTFSPKGVNYGGDADCRKCHGAQLTPIWSSYPVWPGAYFGFFDDLGTIRRRGGQPLKEDREGKLFRTFLTKSMGRGRHQHITLLKPREQILRALASDEKVSYANTNLDYLLSYLNYRRIFAGLRNWEAFPKYQYALIGAFLSCDPIASFFPETLSKEHERRLATHYEGLREQTDRAIRGEVRARLEYYRYLNTKAKDLHLNAMSDLKDIDRIARLRYVLEGAGYSMRDWALNRLPGEREYSYSLANGAWGIGDMLKWHIWPWFRKTTPHASWDGPPEDGLAEPYEVANRDEACTVLKSRSLAALRE